MQTPVIQVSRPPPPRDNDLTTGCAVCSVLTRGDSGSTLKTDLERSAKQGCSICRLLFNASSLGADLANVDRVVSWRENGVFGLCQHDESGQIVALIRLAANGERSSSPFQWLPTLKKSPFTRTSFRDVQMISRWLQDCEMNHSECRSEQPLDTALPTRVLDVGDTNRSPSLVISEGHVGKYMCLSHRWGEPDSTHKRIVTTQDTLAQFISGIPLHTLPLTFRQAVEVTRAIGIQYLWIDSLCIVQDDMEDWERESASMGTIYSHAFGTLFAERAGHGDDGLFQSPTELQAQSKYVQEIGYEDSVAGETYQILVSGKLPMNPATLEGAFCLSDRATSRITDRGWIMQEEILSRRKICFSSTELYWQCLTMSQCDCSIKSSNTARREAFEFESQTLSVLTDSDEWSRAPFMSSSAVRRSSTDLDWSWQRLVTQYTARSLTTEADRLPALAGLASRCFQDHERYLAGIWLHNGAERQLLWYCTTSAHRHHFYAPSWSWASVSGAVRFHGLQSSPNWLNRWTVEDGVCIPSGYNPFGSVSSGYIRIRGPVVPMKINKVQVHHMERQQEMIRRFWEHGGYKYMIDDDTKVFSFDAEAETDLAPTSKPSPSTINFDAFEDLKTEDLSIEKKHLFLVAGTCHFRASKANGFSDSDEVLGLLVRESQAYPGKWERVCVLKPKGFWREWEGLCSDETIILV